MKLNTATVNYIFLDNGVSYFPVIFHISAFQVSQNVYTLMALSVDAPLSYGNKKQLQIIGENKLLSFLTQGYLVACWKEPTF